MWVRTEYGRLVNLDEVYTVRVVASELGHWVQARMQERQSEPLDLSRPAQETEARQCLDLIGESLASGDSLLNLQKLASAGEGGQEAQIEVERVRSPGVPRA